MSVFGQIVSARQVEQAAEAHLRSWLPAYMAELERQGAHDPHWMAEIRSWTTRNQFEKWPEDQLPMVLIESAGIVDNGVRTDGEGTVYAKWRLGIAAIASANTEENTKTLAKLYAAAIRAAMLQHPSLGGFASAVEWLTPYERYDVLTTNEDRSLAAGAVYFAVEVPGAIDRMGGLQEPPDDPYATPPDWPEVETTDVEVQRT